MVSCSRFRRARARTALTGPTETITKLFFVEPWAQLVTGGGDNYKLFTFRKYQSQGSPLTGPTQYIGKLLFVEPWAQLVTGGVGCELFTFKKDQSQGGELSLAQKCIVNQMWGDKCKFETCSLKEASGFLAKSRPSDPSVVGLLNEYPKENYDRGGRPVARCIMTCMTCFSACFEFYVLSFLLTYITFL